MRRTPAVERFNERLANRRGAIEGARITPRFQGVRLWDVPDATRRSFIGIKTEMGSKRNLYEGVCERQIGRCVINRIRIENNEHLHCARLHFSDQFREGMRIAFFWLEHLDSCADVQQCDIHAVGQLADHRRLFIPSDDNAPAFFLP